MPVKKKMNGKGMKSTKPKVADDPDAPVPLLYQETAKVKDMERDMAKAADIDSASLITTEKAAAAGMKKSDFPSELTDPKKVRIQKEQAAKLRADLMKAIREKNTFVGKFKKMIGRGGELTKIESSIKNLKKIIKK